MEVYFGVVLIAEIRPENRDRQWLTRDPDRAEDPGTRPPLSKDLRLLLPQRPRDRQAVRGLRPRSLVTSSCGTGQRLLRGRGEMVETVGGNNYRKPTCLSYSSQTQQPIGVRVPIFVQWEHALSLRRASFIRPVYWEVPMPESPDRDLPPDGLRTFHFHCP